ncbi:hypothetical protein ACRWY2_23455, partial [Escherichia coli]
RETTGVVGKAERLTWHKAWTMVSTGFSISYTSSAMAAGMLTDTSISSLLLPGINAFTRCRSLTSIALSGSRIVTANQTDS